MDSKENNKHGKMPPQAKDIEQAVLGTMMMDKGSLIIGKKLLKVTSFYHRKNQLVFKAILELEENGVDILTVVDQLKKMGKLDDVDGPYYISQLTNTYSINNMEYHCMILIQNELKREQIRIGGKLVTKGYDDTADCMETNQWINDQVNQLMGIVNISQEKTNSDLIREAISEIEEAEKHGGINGVETGFKDIDQITGGWQNSDLIYIAARPSMGKTALVLTMARNIALDHKKHVGFFSLEMKGSHLMKRLISAEADMKAEKLKAGQMNPEDWVHLHKRVGVLEDHYLHIIDDIYDINGIKSKCIEWKMKGKLDCVIIDYLQLIEHPQYKNNREREVAEISRALKLLAKSLDVPIICLSQLSRKVEERKNKSPQLSDLRDSGSIEQDADLVAFLFRGAYYKMKNAPDHLALFMIKKHRNGILKTIELKFEGDKIKFSDWDGNKLV